MSSISVAFEESAASKRACRLARRETACREMTGLDVHAASVSVGRCFHANLDAIIELHALLKPALLPLRECTVTRLRGCVEALLRDSSDISGRRQTLGWATALLRRLIPVLDWEVVLAHARHADPAQAEECLARLRREGAGSVDAMMEAAAGGRCR